MFNLNTINYHNNDLEEHVLHETSIFYDRNLPQHSTDLCYSISNGAVYILSCFADGLPEVLIVDHDPAAFSLQPEASLHSGLKLLNASPHSWWLGVDAPLPAKFV